MESQQQLEMWLWTCLLSSITHIKALHCPEIKANAASWERLLDSFLSNLTFYCP